MHFAVSGVDAPLWLPPLFAFVVSFFTSMGGVSGAFLLLPFQVSVLGYTSPSVSATNQVYNIAAIPSGVYRYVREGRMLWPLTWTVIVGTLPGVFIGSWVRVAYLPDPQNFKLFAGLVLLYIGGRMAADVLQKKTKAAADVQPRSLDAVRVLRFTARRLEFDFGGGTYAFSPAGVFIMCLFVGMAGGIYGIGGGAILAPVFVSVFGLPVYAVAGATLMSTFVTSIAGVIFYHVLALYYTGLTVAPDWLLGLLFGAGGVCGMYLGARCQRFVPARLIKGVLCFCILFVALKYVIGFFV
ncbi:MAG: sulfite exporter TauE/SafE family protein [Elusimicrobiota bacterium]